MGLFNHVAKTKAQISCAVYRADGLRLCFRICIKAGFLMTLFINKDLDKDFRMSDTKLQNEPLDKKKTYDLQSCQQPRRW